MYGTASAGAAWVLLELSGPWGPSAFLQSPTSIDPQLGRAVVHRIEKAGMRVAAIRRHGRRTPTPRWRWFIVNSEPGREAIHRGEAIGPEGYLDLALDGADGQPSTDPVVVVCAHGKHDQCCAVRGRSAVAAIAARYPEITWECSHLGGDRFAATMLILPEGLCYGRVDQTDAARLVDLYLTGRLDTRFLRGRTALPHAVQAAQHFARESFGDNTIGGLAPLSVEHRDGGGIEVMLAGPDAVITVLLGEQLSEPLLSQCRAQVPGPVRIFTLRSISACAKT